MSPETPDKPAKISNLPVLFRFNSQERNVILPYLLERWKCNGNLAAVIHRALLIAHEQESAMEARERREPFIDSR